MKTAVLVLAGMLVAGTAGAALTAAPAAPAGPSFEHLVVKLPFPAVIQQEFKDFSKVPAKIKKKTELDSLGEDGWELVSAVLVKNEVVCFLKRPK
ncbi:MAG: hypothetical protein ACYTAF_03035 [Planctomycetota bacterium]|jgi:hypothetical protein